jgi:hypothetical protein
MGLCYTGGVMEEPTVSAKVITDRFRIPRSTLYRLVDVGKVRALDVTEDYHSRRRFRFVVSDVQADLERIKAERPSKLATAS